MAKITIYRSSCRACGQIFCGISQKEANNNHKTHIKTCEAIEALTKIMRFARVTEKILGRKVGYEEATYMLTGKKVREKKSPKAGKE